jgi:hypothetical protein
MWTQSTYISAISQVLMRVQANPRVDIKRKFRYRIKSVEPGLIERHKEDAYIEDLCPSQHLHVMLISIRAAEL